MSILLLILRLPLLIFHILIGLFTIIFFPKEQKYFKDIHYSIMMFWMKCLSIILGIKVDIRGTPDLSADLYVSNHVTYLDIIIINKLLPVNFIAKEAISSWPIIGVLAIESISFTLSDIDVVRGYWPIILGLILLVVVTFKQDGLLGFVVTQRERIGSFGIIKSTESESLEHLQSLKNEKKDVSS